jgi:peptidoglycan/LPS O-acetylase OafA/YrhL
MSATERPTRRWFRPPSAGVRPEIQALRAAAVLLVVVFHLWPQLLPGGYAGVDVFFVISGYLITSHLLREVDGTGTVRLGAFWARRARRLLPASLLVVVISAIATFLVVPITFWRDFFVQMGAAVAYVLNWQLAADSVDYLAAENDASVVQHYWSLSAEEQFYLVWPLLMLLAVALSRLGRGVDRRIALIVVLAAVTTASFAVSVVLTAQNPAQAYFVTPTRAWEFGVGGLLAFLPVLARQAARVALAWAGFVGIVATAFLFDAATPFPGSAALLPVLSTAAVIVAGTTTARGSVAQLSRFRPVQYLGDVSYSLYLWHWPLIVLAPFALGREPDALTLWVLLGLSVALAALTKRFIEDPARRAPALVGRRPRVTLVVTAAAMAVALVLPVAGWGTARAERIGGQAQVDALFKSDASCLGAAALADNGCRNADLDGVLVPSLALVKQDNDGAFDCSNSRTLEGEMRSCSYGSEADDAVRVAITGDSHGGMLLAGLLPLLDDLNWRLDTYIGRGCTWAAPRLDEQCADYRALLQQRFLDEDYDLVITTAFRGRETDAGRAEVVAQARAEVWAPVIDAGTTVVAVEDNPLVPAELTDCVVERPDRALAGEDCRFEEAEGYGPPDSLVTAAQLEPRARLIRTADLFCRGGVCPMVIGSTIVYMDQHHLTATYSRTLAPQVVARLGEVTDGLVPTGFTAEGLVPSG